MKFIDCHCHIGLSIDGGGITYDEFVSIREEFPAELTIAFAIDEEDKGPTYEALNTKMMELGKKDPGLVIFGRINPHAGDRAKAEVERLVELGVKGIKLHPYSEDFGPEVSAPIVKLAGQLKLPIMLHSSQLSYKEELNGWMKVFELTESPIIAAHAGKDNYRKLCEIIHEFPHLYTDTTAVSFYRSKYVYENAGPHKVVYGSDLPYSHPVLERMKYEMYISPEDREAVYYGNCAKILGIS